MVSAKAGEIVELSQKLRAAKKAKRKAFIRYEKAERAVSRAARRAAKGRLPEAELAAKVQARDQAEDKWWQVTKQRNEAEEALQEATKALLESS